MGIVLQAFFRRHWNCLKYLFKTGKRCRGVYLDPMVAKNWFIGPNINGEDYSPGVPDHPRNHLLGWCIDIPRPTEAVGSLHYVTMPVQSLIGVRKFVIEGFVELVPGAEFKTCKFPNGRATWTPYFERSGDDWTAEDVEYRWYASFATQPLVEGPFRFEVTMDDEWTHVYGGKRSQNLEDFAKAIKRADQLGFVCGGGDGLGHGVYATGTARIVVTDVHVL